MGTQGKEATLMARSDMCFYVYCYRECTGNASSVHCHGEVIDLKIKLLVKQQIADEEKVSDKFFIFHAVKVE